MILMGSKTQEGAHAVRSSSLPYLDPPHHLSTPSLSPPSRASIHVLHHLIEFHAGLVDAKEDNYLSPSHKNISVTMYHRPPRHHFFDFPFAHVYMLEFFSFVQFDSLCV